MQWRPTASAKLPQHLQHPLAPAVLQFTALASQALSFSLFHRCWVKMLTRVVCPLQGHPGRAGRAILNISNIPIKQFSKYLLKCLQKGGRERALHWRCTVTAEDLRLVPNTYLWPLTTACNSNSRRSKALVWTSWTPAFTSVHTNTQIQAEKKIK